MDEQAAATIARWHYPGQYGFYDMTADLGDLAELLEAARWESEYHRADLARRLVGFWQIKQGNGLVREVGLGLAPELTGHGLGTSFVRQGIDFTVSVTGCRAVALQVAEFNRRAITVYERVGFRSVGYSVRETPVGSMRFLAMEMVVPVDPAEPRAPARADQEDEGPPPA
jgi:ribosomal-protein-alanine N-acetyltransferase